MKRFIKKIREKLTDRKGVGTVEIILILVVLIGLVLVFKEQIMSLADSIFSEINQNVKNVY